MRAAFDGGDFPGAQKLGEALIEDMLLSPEVFQLMGHARYRLGDLGRAALWYRRASLFPPPVPEVRQNLAHIHDRTGNHSFQSNSFSDQFSAWLTRADWLRAAVFCGWVVALACALCLLHVHTIGLRALLLTLASLALMTGTVCVLGWHWHPSYARLREIAYVTKPDAKAYTAASTTSGSVVQLPPGSEVRRLEPRGAWVYIEIPSEGEPSRGWVQSEALSPLWPAEYDARLLE